MLKSIPFIKVADLKYKKSSDFYFGGFQLILSNGKWSPMFTSLNQNEKNFETFAIADYSLVKRIKGSILSNDNYQLHKLSFSKSDGSETTKLEFRDGRPYAPESVLTDDEEIIGIFGTRECTEYLDQLGFIVWKPPKI